MTKSSRASRREAARQKEQASASRWLLPAAGLVVVAVAVLAVVLGQGQGTTAPVSPSASSGDGPSASGVAPSSSAAIVPPGEPTITGAALPRFTGERPDPATGLAAPVVHGFDYAGQPVAIAPSGRVTMVIFAAHWCPHCQREIPLVQAWVNGGGLPADVDIVTVSTGIDPTLPNYPPEDWFAREGWTAPVIVDPTNSVAMAYGLAGYPYFVILDGTGAVFARTSGEVPTAGLEEVLAAVPRD